MASPSVFLARDHPNRNSTTPALRRFPLYGKSCTALLTLPALENREGKAPRTRPLNCATRSEDYLRSEWPGLQMPSLHIARHFRINDISINPTKQTKRAVIRADVQRMDRGNNPTKAIQQKTAVQASVMRSRRSFIFPFHRATDAATVDRLRSNKMTKRSSGRQAESSTIVFWSAQANHLTFSNTPTSRETGGSQR